MTIDQFMNCIEGYEKRVDHQTKLTDSLNHILAHYILTAYHEPNKYPKKPITAADDDKKHIATTDEQRLAMVRIKYGKKK